MFLTPSEQIMHTVLQIFMLDSAHNRCGYATGFLFGFCEDPETKRSILCIVTNRHVLEKCPYISVFFTHQDSHGAPDIGNTAPVEFACRDAIFHPNDNIDLAILPISLEVNNMVKRGWVPFIIHLTTSNIPSARDWEEFCAVENVLMAGFPRGLRDEVNNIPIFRSGITATHPSFDFRGEPEFLVDMPCFEGCSGSPVFICEEGAHINKRSKTLSAGNRVLFLGVQHAIPSIKSIGELQMIPSEGVAVKPVMPLYMNLGYIIKSTELLVFEDILREKFESKALVSAT